MQDSQTAPGTRLTNGLNRYHSETASPGRPPPIFTPARTCARTP